MRYNNKLIDNTQLTKSTNKLVTLLNTLNKIWDNQIISDQFLKKKQLLRLMKLRNQRRRMIIKLRRRRRIRQQLYHSNMSILRKKLVTMRRPTNLY